MFFITLLFLMLAAWLLPVHVVLMATLLAAVIVGGRWGWAVIMLTLWWASQYFSAITNRIWQYFIT